MRDQRDEQGLSDVPPAFCQACHDEPPVVRVTMVRDGEEVSAWLCAECARKDVFR